jgi:hypothetical protein
MAFLDLEDEEQVSLPRSIYDQLVADSRALAEMQRAAVARNDRLSADERAAWREAIVADAAECAESYRTGVGHILTVDCE